MEAEHIIDKMLGFSSSARNETGCGADKPYVMSDQEAAYRRALRAAFRGSNLMCYYHVKAGTRDYLFEHLTGTKKEKEKIWLAFLRMWTW